MKYRVGRVAKAGGKLAWTVEPENAGYHIAECEFHFNAQMIVDALNESTEENLSHKDTENTEGKQPLRT